MPNKPPQGVDNENKNKVEKHCSNPSFQVWEQSPPLTFDSLAETNLQVFTRFTKHLEGYKR